jgi:hypothetical protein
MTKTPSYYLYAGTLAVFVMFIIWFPFLGTHSSSRLSFVTARASTVTAPAADIRLTPHNQKIHDYHNRLQGTWADIDDPSSMLVFKDSMVCTITATDTTFSNFLVSHGYVRHKKTKVKQSRLYLVKYTDTCSRLRIEFAKDGNLVTARVCMWEYCCKPSDDVMDDIRVFAKL